MANKAISDLTTEMKVTDIDPDADWLEVDDVSAGVTKKVHPASLIESPVNVYKHLDDLLRLGAEWTQNTSGAGAKITHLAADEADASDAVGAVRLEVASSGESSSITHDTEWADPARSPVFEARVKTPAVLADVSFLVGLRDSGNLSYVRATVASGNWQLECASSTGASSDTNAAASGPSTNTWYDLRIEVDAGAEARLYVDGTLVATVSTAAAIPTSGDRFTPSAAVFWDNASGGRIVLDWFYVHGPR